MRQKTKIEDSVWATDSRGRSAEIVKWYRGDGAQQRAERDARGLFNSEVLRIDQVRLNKSAPIGASHVLVLYP